MKMAAMKRSCACFLSYFPAPIFSILCSIIVPILAQPGFISIDCGGSDNFVSTANISYVTDEGFISTGQNARLPASTNLSTTLQTVRYFPESTPKSCYELGPVQKGEGYIVRAVFYYGNYDSLGSMPIFALIVDATVMEDPVDDNSFYEMYVPAKSTSISVCLARSVDSAATSIAGNPFISRLELRPLPSGTSYNASAFQLGYGLYSIDAVDLGSSKASPLRYPDDHLDRLWTARPASTTNHNLETLFNVEMENPLIDNAPPLLLQTAIVDAFSPYNRTSLSSQSRYHFILFFAEISPNVTAPGQRVFDLYSNVYEQGMVPWYSPIDVFNLSGGQFKGFELFSSGPISVIDNSLLITFKPSSNSTYGPIINGIQLLLYTSEPLSNLTLDLDVAIVQNLRDYYGIEESTGDPCMPINYSWTWIECETIISTASRIISIQLDRKMLKGSIPDLSQLNKLQTLNFANNQLVGPIPDLEMLQSLQTLDLQSNTLTGTIPTWLARLPNLKELFLQNNQLEGEVPSALLALQNNGVLNFTFGGNPKLTCNGISCDSSTTLYSPPTLLQYGPPPPPIFPWTSFGVEASNKKKIYLFYIFFLCWFFLR